MSWKVLETLLSHLKETKEINKIQRGGRAVL